MYRYTTESDLQAYSIDEDTRFDHPEIKRYIIKLYFDDSDSYKRYQIYFYSFCYNCTCIDINIMFEDNYTYHDFDSSFL